MYRFKRTKMSDRSINAIFGLNFAQENQWMIKCICQSIDEDEHWNEDCSQLSNIVSAFRYFDITLPTNIDERMAEELVLYAACSTMNINELKKFIDKSGLSKVITEGSQVARVLEEITNPIYVCE